MKEGCKLIVAGHSMVISWFKIMIIAVHFLEEGKQLNIKLSLKMLVSCCMMLEVVLSFYYGNIFFPVNFLLFKISMIS